MAFPTLRPLTRSLTLPLTATFADFGLAPSGALSLNFSLRFFTHVVAGGRPSALARSNGVTAGGFATGGFGVGVGVGVAVGRGVGTAPARHTRSRLRRAPWYALSLPSRPPSGSVAATRYSRDSPAAKRPRATG